MRQRGGELEEFFIGRRRGGEETDVDGLSCGRGCIQKGAVEVVALPYCIASLAFIIRK